MYGRDLQEAMQLTEAQLQDALYVRQLFCHRMGQLARQRKMLIDKMSQIQVDMCHVSDKLTEMTKWSEQLKEVGASEYRSYMQLVSAFIRGVSLPFPKFCFQVLIVVSLHLL